MAALVLQSFGSEKEYARAIFTIFSFASYSSNTSTRILLFTDRPDFFTPYISGLPIQLIPLTQQELKDMRGKYDFLHRIKIVVIENSFKLTQDNILYADSDTFFIGDPAPFLSQVSPQNAFMHKYEYPFESIRNAPLPSGETARAFIKQIDENKFLWTDGSAFSISPQMSSWNAGVIILHQTHQNLLREVYFLTDQIYPVTLNHASEQFAFSVVLQTNTELNPCESMIYHYWYRVEKQIVDHFLSGHINNAWASKSIQSKAEDAREWSQRLRDLLKLHVWMTRDTAIQAFNENNFSKGYWYSIKSILKNPFSIDFIKDVLHHTRRLIQRQK